MDKQLKKQLFFITDPFLQYIINLNDYYLQILVALGNKTVNYQADLKKIMENKGQAYISDQKFIDPIKMNMMDKDGDQFKKNILQVKDGKPYQNKKLGSSSPRRNSDSIINQSYQFNQVQQNQSNILNQSSTNKHYQSVQESKSQQQKNQTYKNTTSRSDVQTLEQWLEAMLQQIYLQNYQTADEVLASIQLIYTACLKELIRQVSLQCTERGLLIQKVWDAYLNLFERLVEQSANEQRRQEKQYLEDINRISKNYDQNIKLLEKQVSFLTQNTEQLNSKLESSNHSNQVMKEMMDKYHNEIKFKSNEIESLKQNNKILSWDNHNFLQQVEKYKTEKDKFSIDQDNYYQQLMSKQEEEERSKGQQQINSRDEAYQRDSLKNQRRKSNNNELDEGSPKNVRSSIKSKTQMPISLQFEDVDIDNLMRYQKELPFKTFSEAETQTNMIPNSQSGNQNTLRSNMTIKEECENSFSEEEEMSKKEQETQFQNDLIQKVEKQLKQKIEQELKQKIEQELKQKIEQDLEQKYKNQQYSKNKDKSEKVTQTDASMNQSGQSSISKDQSQDSQQYIQLKQQFENMQSEKNQLQIKIKQISEQYQEQIQQQQEQIKQMTERQRQFEEKEKQNEEKDKKNQYKLILPQNGQQNLLESTEDWQKIYQQILNDQQTPDYIKKKVEKILTLLNKEKKQEIEDMKYNHEEEIKQLNVEYSLKQIDTERSFTSKNQTNSFKEQIQTKEEIKELEDAKLEIEEYKENVSDLTTKNTKLINKVKQLKDIIRSQKNTIFKIQDITKQLLAESKKTQASQGGFSELQSPQSTTEDMQFGFQNKEDSKGNESESLSVIDFIPLEQGSVTPKNRNSYNKNMGFKHSIQTKKPPTKDIRYPPQRKNKLDNLMKDLEDLTIEVTEEKERESDHSDFDDYLPQINNIRKASMRLFNNKVTLTQGFKLGQVQKKDRTISANADAALKLLNKVQERIQNKKHQISQTKNNIIKFIISVYIDRIKIPQNSLNPLYVVAYDNIMQKYGLKRVAENKLQQYLESTMKYFDNSRIKMFARLMKIQDSYESQDFDLYIKCLKLFDEQGTNGVSIISQPNDKVFVSCEIAIEQIQNIFKETVGQEKLADLLDWVQI